MGNNVTENLSLVEALFGGDLFQTSLCLIAVFLASTALLMNLIPKVPVLRKATFVPFLFLGPMILSSLDVIPGSHPLYRPLQSLTLYMAIFFMVVAIDVGQILRSLQTRVVLLFLLGCLGTAAGSVAAFLLFIPALGAEPSAMVAACMTGAYTGGSMNWVAVGEALDVPDTLSAIAFPAMVIVYTIYLGIVLALDYSPLRPVIERWLGAGNGDATCGIESNEPAPAAAPRLCDYINGFLAFCAVYLASIFLEQLVEGLVFIPMVIFLTSLTILMGAVLPRISPAGARGLGSMSTFGEASLYFLLGVIGAQATLTESLLHAPILLLVPVLVIFVHVLVLLISARFLKVDLVTTSIVSIATIGGAASAPAAAGALNRPALIPLGVLLGSLGYVVGTYLGVYLGYFLLMR
ncbi:MAG: DUF819 family protein [Thermoguttaceae bacterium]|jgi:uncharacterized membrane protein|nr:DUF819 family protein [Thermoguttaceae bacterium]